MADIPPPNVPGGAMPPKPAEASKVQPKKETVRITLPPKPTAAPTVKLPSMAPATATATTAPAPAAPSAPAAPAGSTLASRPAAAPAPATATAAKGAAPGKTQAPLSRPAPVAARPSALDSVLAVAVGVVALAGAGILFFLYSLADLNY